MKTFLQTLALVFAISGGATSGLADGGRICASERFEGCQLTVFASPNPLRAGPVDVSVLILDSESGEMTTDATVSIELTSSDPMIPTIRAAATSSSATNKLFRSALVTLPAAGEWNVRVLSTVADAPTRATRFTLEAAPPLPRWLPAWPWFAWPFVAVVLFVIHRRLVARRQRAGGQAFVAGECGRVGSLPIVELVSVVR